MYVLLKHHCNNKMKRRLSSWLLHKCNGVLKTVNQLHFNKTSNWLSVKWAMFEGNQTWSAILCLVAWSGNNQDLCLCLWFPSLAFSWHVKSWTLPLYGFWLWFVGECEYRHTDQKRQECHHRQDDYACMLLLAPVIVAIAFWWLQYYCTTGGPRLSSNVLSSSWCDFVTIESTVSANIIRQTTQVNNCTVNIVS